MSYWTTGIPGNQTLTCLNPGALAAILIQGEFSLTTLGSAPRGLLDSWSSRTVAPTPSLLSHSAFGYPVVDLGMKRYAVITSLVCEHNCT